MALDDLHRGVVGQLTTQFELGLEVVDLAVENVALLRDRILGHFVRCHIRLHPPGQQRALKQQGFFQHAGERNLGSEAPCEDVLVGFVTQRFDHATSDGQRGAAGSLQVVETHCAAARDQFLQAFQLGLVLFLDERGQPNAGRGLRLGAAFAGALFLLAQHARGPGDGGLRRVPGLARQPVATTAGIDGRGVIDTTAVDEVVAGARHVSDHTDRSLAGAAGIVASDPWHALIALAALSFLDRGNRIGAGNRLLERHAFRELVPAKLAAGHVSHPVRDRPAGEFRAVEIEPGLQDTVGEQVIETGIGALDDQRRQRSHRAGGVLDHVRHDGLEPVGDAVQLVLQGGGKAHVAADEVAVPANADADRAHVGRARHRYGPAAADAVQHIVANHAATMLQAVFVDARLGDGGRACRRQGANEQAPAQMFVNGRSRRT